MNYLFEITEVTLKSEKQKKIDIIKYLNEMRKIKVTKNSLFFKKHKELVNDLRYSYKCINNLYELKLFIPKKYRRLMGLSFYSKTSKCITLENKKELVTRYKQELVYRKLLSRENNLDIVGSKKLNYIMLNRLNEFIEWNPTVGKVRLQSNVYLKALQERKIKQWFYDKKPLNNKKHIGVEIECYMTIDRDDFAIKLNEEVPELVNKVTLKEDGSLHHDDNGYTAFEICIVDTETDIHETINKVINIANRFDFNVESDCGLHVHLDMRNRDKVVSLNNLSRFQNLLYKLTNPLRKKNKFCKPIRVIEANSYINKVIHDNSDTARYKGINVKSLHRHDTIEIRIHAGTTDVDRISSWIKLLVKITDAKDIPQKVGTSMKKIGTLLDLDNNLLQYVKKYSKIKKAAAILAAS
jgi:hypothetical protein